jgi:hypothetical protein
MSRRRMSKDYYRRTLSTVAVRNPQYYVSNSGCCTVKSGRQAFFRCCLSKTASRGQEEMDFRLQGRVRPSLDISSELQVLMRLSLDIRLRLVNPSSTGDLAELNEGRGGNWWTEFRRERFIATPICHSVLSEMWTASSGGSSYHYLRTTLVSRACRHCQTMAKNCKLCIKRRDV